LYTCTQEMFHLKISQSIKIFRMARTSPQLQSFRSYSTNRISTPCRIPWRNLIFSNRKNKIPFASGFLTGSAVLVAADAALNFDLTLKFSPKGSMQNNLKAIVVALLMCDSLTEEEVDLMSCIIDALPRAEINTFNREKWCENEMTNFMKCTEKFGGIRSESCTTFRTFLKSCLQAKSNCQQVPFSSILSSSRSECESEIEEVVVAEAGTNSGNEAISEIPTEECINTDDDNNECKCTCATAIIEDECDDEDGEEEVDVLEFRRNIKENNNGKAPLAFLL